MKQLVVCRHEYQRHVDHEFTERHTAAALVRCAHEQDAGR
jgi:hypothetical protein